MNTPANPARITCRTLFLLEPVLFMINTPLQCSVHGDLSKLDTTRLFNLAGSLCLGERNILHEHCVSGIHNPEILACD